MGHPHPAVPAVPLCTVPRRFTCALSGQAHLPLAQSLLLVHAHLTAPCSPTTLQVRLSDMWIRHHGDHAREQVVKAMAPADRE